MNLRKGPGSFLTFCLTVLVMAGLVFTAAEGLPGNASSFAPLSGIPSPAVGKMSPSLKLLLSTRLFPAGEKTFATEAALDPEVSVMIKFKGDISPAEIGSLEASGIQFDRVDGKIARAGSIYAARVPWDMLPGIAGRSDVDAVESVWKPRLVPCLDVSAAEIGTPATWNVTDALGQKVTGKGIVLADFDTSVDIYHPMFFKADGDTFDWMDADSDGYFDTGLDGVDLNKDGIFQSNEKLRFIDAAIYDPARTFGGTGYSNLDWTFQAYWDWLYNDANVNGKRDYGTAAGFNENSPSLGERLFIALDTNHNSRLDIGEKLIALGTSKILATMNTGSVERTRGVDLMSTDPDVNGHGTSVTGILAGHTKGFGKFTGIAPDAEIIMGNYFSNTSLVTLLNWAKNRHADVVLYEGASFVWEPLDGSSTAEQTLDAFADSIIQVTPAGNLARGFKHCQMFVQPSVTDTAKVLVPYMYGGSALTALWGTFLWRPSSDSIRVEARTPLGGSIVLDGLWGYQSIDGYDIYSGRSTTSRGTTEFDIQITRTQGAVDGTWSFAITNLTSNITAEVNGYVTDNVTSWADGAEFVNFRTNDKTICSVATADSAFTLASYSTRGYEDYNGVGTGSIPPGALSKFSSRGKRIDGVSIMDIASPGNYDVYSAMSHYGSSYFGGYRQFSGTSAAGPHVAAACGLVKQFYPLATPADIKYRITRGAVADSFTSAVPNDSWGWGKLRVYNALAWPFTAVELPADFLDHPVVRARLCQNYPNPFNPATNIQYELPRETNVRLAVYDAMGRLVKTLVNERQFAGRYSRTWDGLDSRGVEAASGIYFVRLEALGKQDTRKMVLLK